MKTCVLVEDPDLYAAVSPAISHENEVDGRALQELLLCCLHPSTKTLLQARSSVVSGEIERQRLTRPSRGAIALKQSETHTSRALLGSKHLSTYSRARWVPMFHGGG
jgi:hypothetical protein